MPEVAEYQAQHIFSQNLLCIGHGVLPLELTEQVLHLQVCTAVDDAYWQCIAAPSPPPQAQIAAYAQCGGINCAPVLGDAAGDITCSNAAWPNAVCSDSTTSCQRVDDFFWQCLPTAGDASPAVEISPAVDSSPAVANTQGSKDTKASIQAVSSSPASTQTAPETVPAPESEPEASQADSSSQTDSTQASSDDSSTDQDSSLHA